MASSQQIEAIAKFETPADVADLVEAALRFGQRRDLILGSAFINPAWDVMLRLYLAALDGRDLPIRFLSDAQDGSKVTERWLDALVRDGLVAILAEGSDRTVRLTAHGKGSMDALFASAQAGTPVS